MFLSELREFFVVLPCRKKKIESLRLDVVEVARVA
jgi:hypothetical protein